MILRKLRQLLGIGSGSDEAERSEPDVVVQEEHADAETEAAVKGVDEDASESAEESGIGGGDVDEPVATATDADASTESLVDKAEAQAHPESRAEPAEAAGPGADDETTDIEDVEVDSEAESEDGTDLDEIKGIGPAYSDRLDEVGIHTVAQLAEADPSDLAERITVSEKTVGKWVDRAQEFET
ncbi:MAG: DUF4332 domain-containing protein [Halolamina sp.]|uniref:helix-hairpin-helix domain-containing protein n=1 Tax=Halolamina sp. TaxID=1940283 RepID=UPI002FC315FD